MKKLLLGSVLALSFSLLSCNDNSSSGPDKKEGGGIEVPCNAENEGEVVNPADSDKEYVCKDSAWTALDSSRHCEDCKDETIAISSSSSNNNVVLSAESSSSIITSESDESSSSVIASETKQSSSEQSTESSNNNVGDSSSSVETTEDESSSSEETEESSSSEETSMFLCDDGVTYVLDLANCEVESSSSEDAGESSSSEMTTPSSSENVEESSSSEEIVESSSSEINTVSSSSLNSIYDATNNTLTDLRDGQVYKTVTIGTQVWMAQNLNYLPEDTVGTFWAGRSVCGGGEYQSFEEGDCSEYGRLYEKHINAYDGFNQNICPEGWNVPTKKQWDLLISSVGGESVAGSALKSNEKSYWSDDNLLNEYKFSAIPSGYFSELVGFNRRHKEPLAVFTVHSLTSYEGNGIDISDTTDKIKYTVYGSTFSMAIRCIKEN
ncbi:MAG: hypothetical protein IKB43_03790 [Fibrobacter sp.]|nr:hypothetical protein [Fibrobacter sp.]